jgi:hypothetical protein
MKVKFAASISALVFASAWLWACAPSTQQSSQCPPLSGVSAHTAVGPGAQPTIAPPTLAPLPTGQPTASGPAVPDLSPTPLAQPLTREQALQQVISDATRWNWQSPLTSDALRTDPNRFCVEWFGSRAEEKQTATGMEILSRRAAKTDADPVWRIHIQGIFYFHPSMGIGDMPTMTQDSMVYVVAQTTGELLAIRFGYPVSASTP